MPSPGGRGERAGRRSGFPPVRKSLGQHFLNDRNILTRIADALQLTGIETVVEIGPGRGTLTDVLVPRVQRLVAVEYDRALAELLELRYAAEPRVTVVQADVLQVDLAAIAGGDYSLVGNVPYYITTPIIFHALAAPRPRRAVYLVQREVADRIVAPPGSKAYGALSVNVQAVGAATRLFRVPPGAFHPAPKVESAAISIVPRAHPIVRPEDEGEFRRFVIDVFGMRRKQMRRVLRSVLTLTADRAEEILLASGVDPGSRPETLAPEQFAALLRAIRVGRGR